MELQFIFLGSLLSVIMSFASPLFKKHFGIDDGRAKIAIIIIVSLCLAIINFFMGEGFWNALTSIVGASSAFYAIMVKMILDGDDKIAKYSNRTFKL